MTRVGVGELWQEVNSFSPLPTRREDFDVVAGEAAIEQFAGTQSELGGIVDTLRTELPDLELVPALSARAVPRGPVEDSFYTTVHERFIEAFDEAGLDAVVLSLHGAMCTDARHDPEGDLLAAVRATVGDVPVVTSLDHHANVTPRMVEAADALVAFREHPHTGADIRATGERAAGMAVRTLRGTARPTMAMVKAPFVTTTGLSTTGGAMADLFAHRAALEDRAGTLAVSLCPVQPWLDVPEPGFAAVAVTDGDRPAAGAAAADLARAAWDRRDDFGEAFPTVEEAIDRALAGDGPVVVADRGDVTLGGAPGDSPVVLRRLLARTDTADLSAAIPIVDPDAVDRLATGDRGPGTLRVGGRLSPGFDPVEVTGRVTAATDDPLRLEGDYYGGQPVDMGRRVVFRLADRPITLILSEQPGITTDPSFFANHGVDPAGTDLLVVKSIGTFRPGFEPVAGAILICDTPGVCGTDLSRFDHRHARPVYPLDDVEPSFDVVHGHSSEP